MCNTIIWNIDTMTVTHSRVNESKSILRFKIQDSKKRLFVMKAYNNVHKL